MRRSIGIVANPASGRGKLSRVLPQVMKRFAEAEIDVELVSSRSAAHATESATELATRHSEVIAAGGDGLVHYVVNGIIGTGATLGIIPCGTGNDFATNLGYERRRPLDASKWIIKGNRKHVDVARINDGTVFACVAGAGFDSEVNRTANQIKGLRGTAVYVVATLRTLAKFHPARFSLHLDGNHIERDLMFVAIGNASSYGGGMRIAPQASPFDGVLDVIMVGKMSRAGLLLQFPKLFKGTHVNHAAITVVRAKEISIDCEDPFFLYADGEEICRLPVSVKIEPQALQVIVP
ncbi:MAG: diacylglycerol/lipid kinase family protein [Actinomycetota bacterium]